MLQTDSTFLIDYQSTSGYTALANIVGISLGFHNELHIRHITTVGYGTIPRIYRVMFLTTRSSGET